MGKTVALTNERGYSLVSSFYSNLCIFIYNKNHSLVLEAMIKAFKQYNNVSHLQYQNGLVDSPLSLRL